MLKKTIAYTDFDGNDRSEVFYFNLTKTELIKLQMDPRGAFTDRVRDIIRNKDAVGLINLFEELVLKAFGTKTSDGRGFHKSKEAVEEFMQSAAYDSLYVELVGDLDKFAEFINALVPPEVAESAKKMRESGDVPEELKDLMM